MKTTKVKKTDKGNYVTEFNGILFFSSKNSVFEQATFGHFNSIPVKSVTVNYKEEKDIVSNYESQVKKDIEENIMLEEDFKNSTDVKRLDFDSNKILLKSNGKLYRYSLGWLRTPINEYTKTAILARHVHNMPLDESNINIEILEEIEKKRIEYLSSFQKREDREQELIKKYEELTKNQIPATADNIELVLTILNKQNFGSWILPKFTCGYSANQYNCDGILASTIILDVKISDESYGIENENKFVVGAPRGHLNNYRRL